MGIPLEELTALSREGLLHLLRPEFKDDASRRLEARLSGAGDVEPFARRAFSHPDGSHRTVDMYSSTVVYRGAAAVLSIFIVKAKRLAMAVYLS